jgi:hypothetical protein
MTPEEKFPSTPLRAKEPRKKWYAGKRYWDDHVEVVFGNWAEVMHLFQGKNHSHCRGFWREEDARAWVFSIPDRSQFAEHRTTVPSQSKGGAPW